MLKLKQTWTCPSLHRVKTHKNSWYAEETWANPKQTGHATENDKGKNLELSKIKRIKRNKAQGERVHEENLCRNYARIVFQKNY